MFLDKQITEPTTPTNRKAIRVGTQQRFTFEVVVCATRRSIGIIQNGGSESFGYAQEGLVYPKMGAPI